jgi:cytochrome c553
MTARELRTKATELRRTADLVSDDDIAHALIELAEHYEALAGSASEEPED